MTQNPNIVICNMVKQAEVISLPENAEHHDHDYHQLVFGLDGNTEFNIAGDAQPLTTGRGCLLPCATDHAFWGMGKNHIVVINLPTFSNDQHQQRRIEQLFRQSQYISCSSDLQILITALSREMRYNPNDKLLQTACSNTVICALQRHMEMLDRQPLPRWQGGINMDMIDNYIDLNIERRINVAELAGLVYLSSSQFYERFRMQAGTTPQQYVLKRRLDGVLQALKQGHESLAQIASRFGFSNQSALTRAFTAYFNISPARYRKDWQQPEDQ